MIRIDGVRPDMADRLRSDAEFGNCEKSENPFGDYLFSAKWPLFALIPIEAAVVDMSPSSSGSNCSSGLSQTKAVSEVPKLKPAIIDR